jgi:hypothetical protein
MSELNYQQVEEYLRTYTTKCPPYDFNGLLHLILAAVENMMENHLEVDLEDYGPSITREQADFLNKLLAHAGTDEAA